MDVSHDENQLLEDFRGFLGKLQSQVNRTAFSPLLLVFGWLPLWLFLPLILVFFATMVPALHPFPWGPISYGEAAGFAVVSVAVVVGLYFLGRRLSASAAMDIVTALARGRRFVKVCEEKSLARHRAELTRVRREAEDRTLALNERWNQVSREAAQARADSGRQIDARVMRVFSKSDAFREKETHQLEDAHAGKTAQLKRLLEVRLKETESASAAQMEKLEADNRSRWQTMVAEWNDRLQAFNSTLSTLQAFAAKNISRTGRRNFAGTGRRPETFAHAARVWRDGRGDSKAAECRAPGPAAGVHRAGALPGPAAARAAR